VLHERHVNALARGNLVRAHETLREIYDLSSDLEGEEFWEKGRANRPGRLYSIDPAAFCRGPMMMMYVGQAVTSTIKRSIDLVKKPVEEVDEERLVQEVDEDALYRAITDNTMP
jgi:hypothetical protein